MHNREWGNLSIGEVHTDLLDRFPAQLLMYPVHIEFGALVLRDINPAARTELPETPIPMRGCRTLPEEITCLAIQDFAQR